MTEESESLETASELSVRALLFHGQDEYAQAKPLYERVLAIQEKLLGKEHPNVANTLNNFALLYKVQGNYTQAKLLFERSLSIKEKSLSKEHPHVKIISENYATLQKIIELERKNAEQRVQLEEAKKLAYLGVMASGVAHEINQPVGIIRATTSAALDDLKDKLFHVEEIEPLLNRIYQQTERLHAIIENFRRFARGDKSHREPVNINQMIQQTIGMFTEQFKHHHIHLVLQLDDNQPALIADANYFSLQEVLVNFLTNAKDAIEGRENATVWIKSFQEQEHVGFQIEDNGQGLSPDYRNHLFTPFVSTKPTEKGTGLGLYISHKIIQEFNGQLRYEDRIEGGARFIVTLPKFTG